MLGVWGTRIRALHYPLCHPSDLALLGHVAWVGLPWMSGQAQAFSGRIIASPEMAHACIGRGKPVGVAVEAAGGGSDQDRVGF